LLLIVLIIGEDVAKTLNVDFYVSINSFIAIENAKVCFLYTCVNNTLFVFALLIIDDFNNGRVDIGNVINIEACYIHVATYDIFLGGFQQKLSFDFYAYRMQ
jgi:hypothetical protein